MAAFLCRLALYFQLFYYYAFVKNSKVIAIIKYLQDKTENDTEKDEIGYRFFSGEISSKKRYERMMEELGLAMVDTDQEPQ